MNHKRSMELLNNVLSAMVTAGDFVEGDDAFSSFINNEIGMTEKEYAEARNPDIIDNHINEISQGGYISPDGNSATVVIQYDINDLKAAFVVCGDADENDNFKDVFNCDSIFTEEASFLFNQEILEQILQK